MRTDHLPTTPPPLTASSDAAAVDLQLVGGTATVQSEPLVPRGHKRAAACPVGAAVG